MGTVEDLGVSPRSKISAVVVAVAAQAVSTPSAPVRGAGLARGHPAAVRDSPSRAKRQTIPRAAPRPCVCEVPCDVVIVAPEATVANLLRRPVALGARSVFQAIVVGPEELRPELARRSPELAFLCALAHGSEEPELVLEAAKRFDELPGERGALLLELVLSALPEKTRKLLEEIMQSGHYEYKSEYLRGLLERGRTEGRAEGARAALLAVLAARGIIPSDAGRARIEACTEVDVLQRWTTRAVSATHEDEVFAE
jgi:hypothetical protein